MENIRGVSTGLLTGITPSTGANVDAALRFQSILAMMQDDGLIAKDAETPATSLTSEQIEYLQSQFDINDMAQYTSKRALLNELVSLGVLTAEESELSMHQVLPPQDQNFGSVIGTGNVSLLGAAGMWSQNSKVQDMLSEPNYLDYLKQAMELDSLWNRPQEVVDAREKVYGLLYNVFGRVA